MVDDDVTDVAVVDPAPVEEKREPPVVARLVIEIRSDGSHTIARGALQDTAAGQEVAVHAEGSTPLALALSLVKAMLRAPTLGAMIFRRALDKRK
jgi:hypothetical protein